MKRLGNTIGLLCLIGLLYLPIRAFINEMDGPKTDPLLIIYVDEWKKDMKDNNIDYSHFYNIKSIQITHNLGSHGLADERYRTIHISDTIISMGDATMRNAIYHELGHYVFSLEHPKKHCIMYKDNLGNDYYKYNWPTLKSNYINKILNI